MLVVHRSRRSCRRTLPPRPARVECTRYLVSGDAAAALRRGVSGRRRATAALLGAPRPESGRGARGTIFCRRTSRPRPSGQSAGAAPALARGLRRRRWADYSRPTCPPSVISHTVFWSAVAAAAATQNHRRSADPCTATTGPWRMSLSGLSVAAEGSRRSPVRRVALVIPLALVPLFPVTREEHVVSNHLQHCVSLVGVILQFERDRQQQTRPCQRNGAASTYRHAHQMLVTGRAIHRPGTHPKRRNQAPGTTLADPHSLGRVPVAISFSTLPQGLAKRGVRAKSRPMSKAFSLLRALASDAALPGSLPADSS